ncbi:hypothetical protein MAPG_02329 [Magnaporthiopsis poae ATCC 64411]|uniref:Coenzyme Q biosynthesis protein 4 n=1 Tax=Magnaporthiopsis poae (strain ATCC 64411 / 73-15) TaxID=644358 RepID=A0A0C4DR28_MAGP6|nr:hypothetical protein MAPG_02329 [Magnaporthiopsis poae ATCC 64411]
MNISPVRSSLKSLSRGHGWERLALVACPSIPDAGRRQQNFSVLNRPPPNYPGHVPLTGLERAGLAIGSGLWSIIDPRRGGGLTVTLAMRLSVALKAFEFCNTLLPMTGLATLAAFTLKPGERKRFTSTYLPWAVRNGLRSADVINVYWEEVLERDVVDLRRELGVEAPPDMRDARKREREERRRRKQMAEAAAHPQEVSMSPIAAPSESSPVI